MSCLVHLKIHAPISKMRLLDDPAQREEQGRPMQMHGNRTVQASRDFSGIYSDHREQSPTGSG